MIAEKEFSLLMKDIKDNKIASVTVTAGVI
jgi:hypothetical protein